MLEKEAVEVEEPCRRIRVFLPGLYQELGVRASPLIEKWSAIMGLDAPDWGIKRMKTKWGTCNIEGRRVWLNLELIKKPEPCLEYVIVHELTHFFERSHSDRFVAMMDRWLPQWRTLRAELNSEPLSYEEWQSQDSQLSG